MLRSWVRIPAGAWMSVCRECCVLLGRGICNELITRPEESYRLWCVVVCDIETLWMRRHCLTGDCHAKSKQEAVLSQAFTNRPPTTGDWFRSQASLCGIYCEQSDTDRCFSPSTEVALYQCPTTKHNSDDDLCSRPICSTSKEIIKKKNT